MFLFCSDSKEAAMTSYTAFAEDLTELSPRSGLGLAQAFAWVLGASGSDFVFEKRSDGHALILWDASLKTFAPREITTRFVNEQDARTALMFKAIVEGINGYRALPDEVFRERLLRVHCDLKGEAGAVKAS
jgi:hypothetical protein